jgi:asparagine synthase (glutamine-hydrolysing)
MHAPFTFLLTGQAKPAQGAVGTGNTQSEAMWRAAWPQGFQSLKQATRSMSGGFALALQSADNSRAFLAVDQFAVQTLCYRIHHGRLQVASSADALVGPGAALSAQALFHYLYFHCIPSPQTVFDGVLRLPPGHCAWFDNGQLTVEPFASPAFCPDPNAAFGHLKSEFMQVLEQSVQRSLGPGTPACFLSGGTDSSTVAGMLGRVAGARAHSYSIGFEAEGYDEMAYARLAARHFNTVHHEYYVTPEDLVRSIGQVAAHYDQPFGNSSALPAYYCALKAREDGVQHILAGDGGDELFGGNSRYAKQRVFGWYDHVPAPLRKGLLQPLLEGTALGSLPGLRKGRSYVEQAKVPMPGRLQMYNLLLRLGTRNVLTPEFLEQVDAAGPLQLQQQVWDQVPAEAGELNRTLAYDWRFTLAESDLPKVRGTTGLAGLGVGFPMLDNALLDFSLRLPDSYKLKGMKLRWFFKEALRGFLPDEIIIKPKQGFGLPFGPWMVRHAGLHKLAADSLGSLSTRGLVQPAFIRELLDTRLAQHPGYYGEMVWILMMLEQWLQAKAPQWRLQ